MNDPFFDEDDGEFDDLYGQPPPSTSSPSERRKPRRNEAPAASPATPGGRPSTRSPAASSSVASRSYARDRASSSTSTTTDLAASGKQDKRRKRHGKLRRKGSQEMFDVQWESDVRVTKCGLCASDFSLVRRKHHCRHCGRVMCSDCSSFLYFEFSRRKHRVCATCNNQLLAEQDAYDRETAVFDDAGDDGRPSVAPASCTSKDAQQNARRSTLTSALTPKHNGDDDKTRKKQEKKERKKREKLEKKKGGTSQVLTPAAAPSRKQTRGRDEKPAATLFDGADDDWFTDVPDQHGRSRDSGDEFTDDGGSKGPGWRDRVKDTYTVTAVSEQASVLPSMTGSALTAGITGKGYISDQFRYDDVGGPGLGHDDGLSIEMPRPMQQSATTAFTDHSVKPSRLTGNGYYSEQFQYDAVGGPGLGHDDDRSIAMPRPKQQPVAAPYSYDREEPSQRQSEHDTFDASAPPEQDFQPRLTIKDNLKDMFSGTKRRESTARQRERKPKASKPRARGNENMTLDELNPSYSSEDEPRMLTSAMPRLTAQPTYYDNDADKLVVDDSPGFFEATVAEREAQRIQDEGQQRQLASDMAWVNSSALPPSVPAHRFSSEQESYSIVDHPSHTSHSPVESHQDGGSGGEDAAGNAKGGFTGALKRFFGMGSKAAGKKATTPPKSAKKASTPVVTAPAKADKLASAVPDSTIIAETASSGLERHTVLDYSPARVELAPQESFRYSTTGYVGPRDVTSRFEASVPSRAGGSSQGYEDVQRKPEHKRRDTFDDLFESPKNHVAVGNTDRYSTTDASGWTARVGESASAGRASYGATAVEVSRLDERRPIDEGDGFTFGDEPRSVYPPAPASNDPIEAWRQSAAMSLLEDQKDAAQSERSGFTWSNVRSVPELGSATYAVPTSLQPRAAYDDDRSSLFQHDPPPTAQPPSLGNIMDDLKRGSTSKKAQGKESVDDFFAEFEEPNDYVFDPATGGYVATRVPPRVAVAQHVTRSESTELLPAQTVPDRVAVRNSERDYSDPSGLIASSTAVTIASKDGDGGGVQDEVAEIIVDKISSLESELAALKQLIRNRKGSGGSNKPRASHSAARPSARKESIFDNDSSDESDSKPSDPYASSIRQVSKRESKRRPASKMKHAKKRKDSFADLFEDSPNENDTLGGTTNYEALFQTGATAAGRSIEQDSDDDGKLSPKLTKTRSKSRHRSSRKINDYVPAKEVSDGEPELTSLKGRRGKHSSRRKIPEDADDATPNLTSRQSEGNLVPPSSVDVVPAAKLVKNQIEEEDPIDALFDTSSERDVTKLYGGDDAHDGEVTNSTLEPKPAPILKGTRALLTQASSTSLTNDGVSGTPSSTATNMESVVPVSKESSGLSYSLDSHDLGEADEEEDFSINWSKMRKNRSRRHKSRRSSSKTIGESTATENTAGNLPLLEPNLLDGNSELQAEVNDTPAEHEEGKASPSSIFLADAASNWMSVSTLEEEAVNGPGGGDLESLLHSEDESKSPKASAESVAKNADDRYHKTDIVPSAVSTDDAQIEAITSNSSTIEVIPTEEVDESVENAAFSVVAEPLDAKANQVQEYAGFGILDKSGDLEFLSVTLPLDLTTPDHEGGSEDDDKESLPDDDEAFSFELKAPKKLSSALDVCVGMSSPPRRESSPPSPASSADDNVEFDQYATPSAPSSSVDGSLDDPEDESVDDELVLGKVESQAFDTDWQQMQVKEKERKKRLQVKQRQAQRDKVLRKQGVSSKSLSSNTSTHGSSKSKSNKSGKKKKVKEKDDAAPSSSHRKKSSSSRKHRHREKGDAAPSEEPPRSLTEL
ncbi:hypothetical protein PHYPSEUDO_001376 [Phytophthora pseudosyringae]|uniref:FYVE-type domain-containing protein n=1 Tax=Phytophthora pseudosyringae TaxID=221518 RepID=A0A8T1WDT8_9STRA|nr:hypothetical protein PHYPSEUDO_001376 [Phytophthora pseudosyringae]